MDSDQLSTFNIQESFLLVLREWWWFLVFMLAGAFLGWGFTQTQPVEYEARASINFRVDYVRTGGLSDVREDALLSWPEDIFYSPEVIGQVRNMASQRGLSISETQFREQSSLERQDTRWAMVVRNQSAEEAVLLVNDWTTVSEGIFNDALAHSIMVDSLRRYQDGLVSCLEQAAIVTKCPFDTVGVLQTELEKTIISIKDEEKLARGASPAIQLVGVQFAEGNGKAVRYIHNQVIFGGAIIGAILGAIFIEVRVFTRRRSARIVQ